MSKRHRKMSPAAAGVLISAAATLFVAATAFRLAYAGSKGAAGDAGLNTADASWYPLCIEGVLVVAAVATVVLRSPYPWVVLLSFSALSIGANVQHAVDQPGPADWFMLLVAAVPPAALPLCVELSIRIVKKLTAKPAASGGPVSGAATGQEGSPTSTPPAPPIDSALLPAGVESSTREGRTSGAGSPALTAAPGPGDADAGRGLSATPSAPPVRPETAPAGDPGGEEHSPAGAPDSTAGAPGGLHLVPAPGAPDSTPPSAPGTALGNPRPSAPGRTSARTHAAVTGAPAGAPKRTRVTAPASALDRTDEDLASALRELRATAPAGALDSIRPVARELRIGQDRARRVLALVDQPAGDTS